LFSSEYLHYPLQGADNCEICTHVHVQTQVYTYIVPYNTQLCPFTIIIFIQCQLVRRLLLVFKYINVGSKSWHNFLVFLLHFPLLSTHCENMQTDLFMWKKKTVELLSAKLVGYYACYVSWLNWVHWNAVKMKV